MHNLDTSRRDNVADRVLATIVLGICRMVITCGGTLIWAVAWWTAFHLPELNASLWAMTVWWTALGCVSVAAVLIRNSRVKSVLLYSLPVVGDWRRFQRRRARRRGNEWLRETGLVHGKGSDCPVDYTIWLWSDRLEIKGLMVVGVTEERLRKAIESSLVSWDMADYEMNRTGNSSWLVHLYQRSRLDLLKTVHELDDLPETMMRIGNDGGHLLVRVGRCLDGDAWIDFSGVSGVLLAGLPGCGKTAAADLIVAGLLSRPDLADVFVLDGKGGADWLWAREFCTDWSNDDGFTDSLELVRRVHSLMMERLRTNYDRFGESNAWHRYGAASDLRVVCLVVDELQTYVSPASTGRDVKTRSDEFVRLLTDIAKKGRSACVCLLVATQKPTSDAIPTGLRDVMACRYAFHVSTSEMAKACLGDIPNGDPSPVDIPFESKGLAVMNTTDGGTTYVRFDYLSEENMWYMLRYARYE